MPRPKLVSDADLLDVVVRFIGERGPGGFTLADLGKQVGLSPATLIQRFGSKHQLIESAIGRVNERLAQAVSRVPSGSEDTEAALVEWFVDLAHPFRTRPLIASHLVFLRRDLLDATLRAKASRHSRLVRRRVCQYLEAMRSDLAQDARPIATALEAHWHGLVIQWAIAGQGPLDAWLRTGLTLFLRALRVRSVKTRRNRARQSAAARG